MQSRSRWRRATSASSGEAPGEADEVGRVLDIVAAHVFAEGEIDVHIAATDVVRAPKVSIDRSACFSWFLTLCCLHSVRNRVALWLPLGLSRRGQPPPPLLGGQLPRWYAPLPPAGNTMQHFCASIDFSLVENSAFGSYRRASLSTTFSLVPFAIHLLFLHSAQWRLSASTARVEVSTRFIAFYPL